MTNENTWDPTTLNSFVSAVVAFISAVVAGGYTGSPGALEHVIPRYTYTYTDDPAHHKWLKERTGLEGVHVVQSYFGVARVGSQRRRLAP
jgi:hypothetical protein